MVRKREKREGGCSACFMKKLVKSLINVENVVQGVSRSFSEARLSGRAFNREPSGTMLVRLHQLAAGIHDSVGVGDKRDPWSSRNDTIMC